MIQITISTKYMSLPVITDTNSLTPDGHVKLYVINLDRYRYGDKVVLIDMSHPFQVMSHLQDVLAQSFMDNVKAHRVKLSIVDEMDYVSDADRISDVVRKIEPVDGLRYMTMVVEDTVPVVYPNNSFDMRKMLDMFRTSDP